MNKKIFNTAICFMCTFLFLVMPVSAEGNRNIKEANTESDIVPVVSSAASTTNVICTCTKAHAHIISVTSTTNIKPGEKSTRVRTLQALLVKNDFPIGSTGIDGSYGPATQKAVKAFQNQYGLKQDAIVGTGTASTMQKYLIKSQLPCPN